MAGTARWLLDERGADAVAVWVEGLDCPYADAAGGMELPLLLLFAGSRYPGLTDVAAARSRLTQLGAFPQAQNGRDLSQSSCWAR